ncbi:hypothetical protein HJFPF1_10584 [Paramyrothecium foliicola]|nr:hypothetical protein HJFPF1_10584 [Paramyrothecium foliicola]
MTDSKLCDACCGLVLTDKDIFESGNVVNEYIPSPTEPKPTLTFRHLAPIRDGLSFDSFSGAQKNLDPQFFHHIALQHSRHDVFPSFPQLKKSAERGCGFCRILREAILLKIEKSPSSEPSEADEPPEWADFKLDEEIELNFGYFLKYFPFNQNSRKTWRTYTQQDEIGLGRLSAIVSKKGARQVAYKDAYASDTDPFIFGPTHVNFSIQVDKRDSPVGRYLQIYDLLVNSNPVSDKVIQRIVQWITMCISAHKNTCSADDHFDCYEQGSVPTRLLWIGEGDLRLVLPRDREHPPGIRFPYAAFSYCWGDHVPLKTEKATLTDRMRGIPMDALPAAFKDVVTIARALGIGYIWIDALCIVQDDAEDWRKEAAKMADVYRKAVFTIVAASSTSASESFLESRPETVAKGNSIKFPFSSQRYPNISGYYFVSSCKDKENHGGWKALDELDRTRWATRAWTFQEQYLSRRLIIFGPSMTQFHCREWSLREDSIALFRRELSDAPMFSRDDHADCSEHEHENSYAVWYQLIEQFSTRQATFRSDRLPSIQGVASEMANYLVQHGESGEYFAGLWKGDMRQGLAWQPHPSHERAKDSRPSDGYIAPSWSWASYFGPVKFISLISPGFGVGDILEAKTALQTDTNSLGAVMGGLIVIQGPAKSFDGLGDSSIAEVCGTGNTEKSTANGGVFLDRSIDPPDKFPQKPIWLLPIWASGRSKSTWKLTGLVLEQANRHENANQFTRVGSFEGVEQGFEAIASIVDEGGWPRRTFEII